MVTSGSPELPATDRKSALARDILGRAADAVDVDLAACGSAGVELFAAWERVTALDAPLDFVPASAPPLDASRAAG